MASTAEPESKTQLLRQLYKDVVQLKKDLEPLQQTSLWVKNNFKQTLDGLKESLEAQITKAQTDLGHEVEYSRNITQWIKDSIGTKLEKVKEIVQQSFEDHVAKQLEDTKLREESLWAIFNSKMDHISSTVDSFIAKTETDRTKMEEYFQQQQKFVEKLLASQAQKLEAQFAVEKQKLESQLSVLGEEVKKAHAARVKMETTHATMQDTYDKTIKEGKDRPEAEMAMFRKLVKKLEDERKRMEDETKKMEDERKKMEEERKKFNSMVKDERVRFQERQLMDLERAKLAEERQRVITERQLSSVTATASVSPVASSPEPIRTPSAPVVAKVPSPALSEPVPDTPVSQWLRSNGFETYAAKFHHKGYDTLQLVALLDDDDLNTLEVTLPGHRKGLLAAVEKLRAVEYGPNTPRESTQPPTSAPTTAEPAPASAKVSLFDDEPVTPSKVSVELPPANAKTTPTGSAKKRPLPSPGASKSARPLPKPGGGPE